MPRFLVPETTSTAPNRELVADLLVEGGVTHHVEAVADLFLASCEEPPNRDPDTGELDLDAARRVEDLARHLRTATQLSTEAVLIFAGHVLARGVQHKADVHALGSRLADHLHAAHGASDFTAALVTLFQTRTDLRAELKYSGVLGALLLKGLVDPARIMDPAAIRTTTKGIPGVQWQQNKRELDPSLPDYWVTLDPARAVAACDDLLGREPIETLGVFAIGLERALSLRYPGEAKDLYPHLGTLTLHLLSRRRDEKAESDRLLTRCCWVFARTVFDAPRERLPEEHAAPLTQLALEELGRLRSHVRTGSNEAEHREYFEYVDAALFFVLVAETASLWDVLRRLLLAFRELPVRSVPLDLRTWKEGGREDPGWVPEHISRVLEFFLGRELRHDPDLEGLRTELAKFFLERLKTREKGNSTNTPLLNEDLVEPNPLWRRGYVHALRELRANPGGRGHHVLAWSHEHDPDDDVRADAQAAYKALRRAAGIPKDTSPRRVIYAAFWCLRQAHVLAVGQTPDQHGAQRTFRKEVRRSRDLDARD